MNASDMAVPSAGPFQWPHGSVPHDLEFLCAGITRRLADDPHRRVIIGLVGEPGAGKSTLARELVIKLEGAAALVPMDGFHLSNQVLEQLGRRNRKGAPDTFDAHGFVHLVSRLRYREEDIVYAPNFLRELDESVAAAIPVHRSTPIVILEGNYLLLDEPPWHNVRQYLDTAWYVDLERTVRLHRLAERHQSLGRAPAEAKSWATTQDETNANLIRETRRRAGLIITMQ